MKLEINSNSANGTGKEKYESDGVNYYGSCVLSLNQGQMLQSLKLLKRALTIETSLRPSAH